jgi:hypothetical protein
MLMVESATKLLGATVLWDPWGSFKTYARCTVNETQTKHVNETQTKPSSTFMCIFMYNKFEQLLHAIDYLRQRPTPLAQAVCFKPTWNSKCFKHSNGNTNHLNSKTIFRHKVTKHKTHVPTKLF